MRKRGQMEVIGLVVIVILITLGMLFMAAFALKSDPQKKIFTRKGLAYSTMSAVMKATVSENAECRTEKSEGLTPRLGGDIVQDCAQNRDTHSLYKCKSPLSKESEEWLHSCAFFEEMVIHLLDQTLGSWNKKYEFHSQLVALEGEKPIPIIDIIQGGCKGKDRDSSGLFPITTDAGLVENVLYLCD